MFTKTATALLALSAFVGSSYAIAVPLLDRRGGPVICKAGVWSQEGDTCESLALANNVTPIALQAVNTILRPDFSCDPIEAGIIVCIPGNPPYDPVTDTHLPSESRTPLPSPTNTETPVNYPVMCKTSVISQDGDTCASVAAANGVTEADFYWTQVLLRGSFDCDNIGG
ncbi:hypothetical protein FRC17_007067 [Serendipita sp. 399]|nr:hypothetical protein FRC17_007067 [Serendipita sp. 399]